MNVPARHAFPAKIEKQRDFADHALTEPPDARQQYGPPIETGMLFQLRYMLVLQRQAVDVMCLEVDAFGFFRLERLDHLPAAAGIAGDRIDRDGVIRRDQAFLDQWPQEQDRPGRITAGIGDPPRGRDLRRMGFVHFRQAVHPVRARAMGRAAVDDADGIALHETDGLPGRVIGQAQDRHIGLV